MATLRSQPDYLRGELYLRFWLSYRDVEELLTERGLGADHTTIWRWVQCYAPILDQRCRRELKPTNGSWRVDEATFESKANGPTFIVPSIPPAPRLTSCSLLIAMPMRPNAFSRRRCELQAVRGPES